MTLQLYILRVLLTSLGFALAGIGLIVVPSIAVQAVHKLGGVSLLAVFEYLPLVLVELVPYLLPMAFLLAVVATYGKLEADNEWTAIRMAGIHPVRILLPGLAVALVLGAATNHLLGRVAPDAKFTQRDYLRNAEVDELRGLVGERTEFDLGPFFVKAATAEGNLKRDVLFSAPGPDGEEQTLVADSARFDFVDDQLVVEFEGVTYLTADAQPYFERFVLRLPLDEISPVAARDRNKAKYLSTPDLRERLRRGLAGERHDEFVYEIHRRMALAFTYVLFLLLGVPTGMLLKSGTQLAAFSGAVGYSFLYYVLALRLGKELARAGILSSVAAAWSTDALFLVVGLAATVYVFRR